VRRRSAMALSAAKPDAPGDQVVIGLPVFVFAAGSKPAQLDVDECSD